MLSGRGLCDELITRPEESNRLWCAVVCDLENLKNEKAMARVGSQSHSKKKAQLGYSRLKFTLKFTLKCSYMFRLANHHQGAYCRALLTL